MADVLVNDPAVRVLSRDPKMREAGWFSTGYFSLTFRESLNGPGGWALTFPGEHPSAGTLAEPGDGIVVLDADDGVLFSGPVGVGNDGARIRQVLRSDRGLGSTSMLTVTGPSDLGCLWHRVALPTEGLDADVVSGQLGVALPALVERNAGPLASPDRAFPGWRVQSAAIGPHVSIQGRYGALGDLCVEAIGVSDWRMAATWARGSVTFDVSALELVKLPVSIEAGTASSITADITRAQASAVYALGEGEGAGRSVFVSEATGGDPWRRVEAVVEKSGQGLLASAASAALETGGRSLSVTFSKGRTPPRVGQMVEVRLGAEVFVLAVAESTTEITPDRHETVVTLGREANAGINGLVRRPANSTYS